MKLGLPRNSKGKKDLGDCINLLIIIGVETEFSGTPYIAHRAGRQQNKQVGKGVKQSKGNHMKRYSPDPRVTALHRKLNYVRINISRDVS